MLRHCFVDVRIDFGAESETTFIPVFLAITPGYADALCTPCSRTDTRKKSRREPSPEIRISSLNGTNYAGFVDPAFHILYAECTETHTKSHYLST